MLTKAGTRLVRAREHARGRRRRGRRPARWSVVALVVAVFAALAGGVLFFSNASRENHRAAVKWRERAQTSDKLLTARTHQLNARAKALNRTVDSLARSERDVSKLESRQRVLADEKAQVEDQRGAMVVQTSQLAQLADEQRVCSDGLAALLNAFAADDYEAVAAEAPTVDEDCRTARENFAAFQQQYGAG